METPSIIDKKLSRRSTEQRQLLLEIIQKADGHLDADEIYRLARQRLPSLSLSTVYRSLQLFKGLGLVEEHQFDGIRRYYEAMPRAKHYHLVCLGCGRIFEFHCPSAERLKSRITREEGFKVTDTEVRLVGYCPECQRRLSDSRTDTDMKQQGVRLFRNKGVFSGGFWAKPKLGTLGKELKVGGEGFSNWPKMKLKTKLNGLKC